MISSLQALGLEQDADERDVRRAYARRVKAIDPATDPGGFQTLREHYEAALEWVRAHAQADRADAADIESPGIAGDDGEPDSTTPASPRLDAEPVDSTPVQVNLWADADGQVFAEFAEAVAQVFTDEAAARAALERAQEDPRLVNLEARARFELRVAQLLTQGWRPGHQFLFRAACDAFHWERERSRLFSFGPVGALLDAAITENLIFYQQPEYQFAQLRSLVVRLREDPLPSNDALARERERLQMLAQRFPHWLHVLTSSANVARWQEALQALPPALAPAPRAARAPAEGSRQASSSSDWFAFLIVIGILVFAVNLFSRVSGPSRNSQYRMPTATAARLDTFQQATAPVAQPQPSSALHPARPVWPLAAGPVASAPAASRAKPRADTGRAAGHAAQASRPGTPGAAQPHTPAWVGQVPGTFDLSASEPVWVPLPQREAPPPNRLKPSLELPTLSETDPANAAWRKGISYELVPRNPEGPASAPLLAP